MFIMRFIAVLLLSGLANAAQIDETRDFDRLGILAFLQSRNITTVEDFVRQAQSEATRPGVFQDLFARKNQFIAYKSSSRQPAMREDPANPRVILSAENGKFLLAYSGLSEFVEIIQFNDASRKFEFRQIAFTPRGLVPTRHDDPRDPTCMICHSGRPNWDSYPLWPGFYGGSDGNSGQPEQELMHDFNSSREASPLYRDLDPRGGQLLTLTNQLARLNAERIARIVRESPHYSRYKFAVISALLGCEKIEAFAPRRPGASVFSEVLANTQARHDEYFRTRRSRLIREAGMQSVRGNIEPAPQIARLRYVAQFLALKPEEEFETWSMSLPEFDKGYGPGALMGFQNPDITSLDLIRISLVRQDPELAKAPRHCAGLLPLSQKRVP